MSIELTCLSFFVNFVNYVLLSHVNEGRSLICLIGKMFVLSVKRFTVSARQYF